MRKTTVIVFLLLTSGGCGPKSKQLFRDSNFSGSALKESGLALLGTINLLPRDAQDLELARLLDSCLEFELSQAMPSVSMVAVDSMRSLLGDELFRKLRFRLEDAPDIDETSRTQLARVADRVPAYMLVGHLIENRTWTTWANDEHTSGNVCRKLEMQVDIYDTRTAARVWSSRASAMPMQDAVKGPGLLGNLAGSALGITVEGTELPPPPFLDVLGTVYRKTGSALAELK